MEILLDFGYDSISALIQNIFSGYISDIHLKARHGLMQPF